MNYNMSIISIIIAGVILLLIILENIIAKSITSRLVRAAYSGKFEEYEILRKKFYTKYLIHPFNLCYADLNMSIIQANYAAVEANLEKFDNMRLNKKQRFIIYERAFYYYVLQRNEKRATHYYRLANDIFNDKRTHAMDVFYDTFVEKGYRYLDEILEELKTVPDGMKSDYEAIASQMYENKGDVENAVKYKNLSESHFAQLDAYTKAQWEPNT